MSLSVKQRLARGDKLLGCIMLLPSPDVAEIVALSGIDVALIDQEHGTGGLSDFVAQERALRGSEVQPLTRFPGNNLAYAQALLDAGAQTIVCPGVETAEEAEAFVRACHYPPAGDRGVGTGVRASRWGSDKGYYDAAAADMLLVAQIETARAIENVDAICAVRGIDMLLIGPRDLAASIGSLNRYDNTELWRMVRHAEQRILASGKYLASALHPGRSASSMFADGYDLILCGKDVDFLLGGARAAIGAARTLQQNPPSRGSDLPV